MEEILTKIKEMRLESIDRNKQEALKELFEGKSSICAFSGGIDSSLLLIFAKAWAKRFLAITIHSEFVPQIEIENAKKFTEKYAIEHDVLKIEILENEAIAQNPKNRCYICKSHVFDILSKIAKIKEIEIVMDGTNYDDISQYRPGLVALKEKEVLSPFLEAKVTKQEIINISKELGLESSTIPPMACMASRIPYEVFISKDILSIIEKSEDYLRKQIPGIDTTTFRVRYDINNKGIISARIECNPDFFGILVSPEIREKVLKYFADLGFNYITLDLGGIESGKIDKIKSQVK